MALATAPTKGAVMGVKRAAIMKQREKERLERLLTLMFGYRYPLHWTNDETSYFDGKACYVKYDVQTEYHREFTLAEQRVIRQHHAFHERGHEYFDFLEDYRDWIKEMSSPEFKDWQANEKYPQSWVQFFGNTGMDGRMELLVTSSFPTQEDFFEFGNYEWRFGIRGENAGEEVVYDFRECYMHRALGMEDLEEWEPLAVALVNDVQKDINRLRRAATTKDCLDITTKIMKAVWPQLMEWMDIQEQDYTVVILPGPPIDDHDNEEMSWSSREDAEERAERAFKKAGIKPARSSDKEDNEDSEALNEPSEEDDSCSEGESTEQSENGKSEPSETQNEEGESSEDDNHEDGDSDSKNNSEGSSDNQDSNGDDQDSEAGEDGTPSREEKLQQLLDSVEQQMEKEQQEMDSQEKPFEQRQEPVNIKDQKTNISEHVTIKEYPRTDLAKYNEVKSEVSSQIGPFGRAMKELLEGTPDEFRRNQKKGRLQVNSVWKAQRCENVNIYDRTIKGTPAKNAVVFSQFDNSGSTWGEVVKQMQKASVLITEGCEKAKVPHYSYAFTEDEDDTDRDYETQIFPLKPTDKLTDREKGYIGGMEALSGNRDTLVLQWTVDQIAKRPEEIKLLIMVSDGLPIFKAGVEDETTMRNIVLKAEKRGIDVLCLFVGHHRPEVVDKVRYMYNNHVISVESNVAKEMQKQIKRIIRNRRG